MRKLIFAIALACGALLLGPGLSGDAQAKPKGWHGHKGHHYGHSYGPRRHHGWNAAGISAGTSIRTTAAPIGATDASSLTDGQKPYGDRRSDRAEQRGIARVTL